LAAVFAIYKKLNKINSGTVSYVGIIKDKFILIKENK